MKKKVKTLRAVETFDELLDLKYGKLGTKRRDEFEEKAYLFIVSEMLKAARREANLTQQELAERIGTKKSYISRIENGKVDIQLSTLFKLFEQGLGRKISLSIQ
jgi:HTH-type transcriptional regulator / antitoxin HipB